MTVYLEDATPPDEVALLTDAARLIRDPAQWIKYRLTDHSNGVKCFCALGAFKHASRQYPRMETSARAFYALNSAAGARGYGGISLMNDDPRVTHADVVDLFQRAIVMLRKSRGNTSVDQELA